jgi:predicted ATPase
MQWFNNDMGRWEWDLAKIQAMQYAENVVEFMAQDLGNLPERTLRLLKVAAFFGGRFDIRDIAQYCRVAVEEEERVLWPALQQGITPSLPSPVTTKTRANHT